MNHETNAVGTTGNQSLKHTIESLFTRWAAFAFDHKFSVVTGTLLFFVGLASQLPQIQLDTSIEGFLFEDDPGLVALGSFRQQFGNESNVVIGIRTDDVFSEDFLLNLRNFHQRLENEVPYLDTVDSLINARAVYGDADTLIVEDLFENWPANETELARLVEFAKKNHAYQQTFFSDDYKFAVIMLKLDHYATTTSDDVLGGFDEFFLYDTKADATETEPAQVSQVLSGDQNDEAIAHIVRIINETDRDDFRLFSAGQPLLTHVLQNDLANNMQKFVLLAIGSIATLLFILFRTLSAVIPPLIVVIMSLVSTIACMAIAGVPIQAPTQIIPSFLLAVGVADSVHILAIFHQQLQQGAEKRTALIHAMSHSGVPVLFTSLTTAGGLISFATSDLVPVSNLGYFAPLGVIFAMLYSVILLPALIAIMPAKARTGDTQPWTSVKLQAIGVFSARHAKAVLTVTGLVILISLASASRLYFSHDPVAWLADDSDYKISQQVIDSSMAGTMSIEIIFKGATNFAMQEPEFLTRMDAFKDEVEKLSHSEINVGKTFSIIDILKETHQALNENKTDHYQLADSRQAISQELLLFETGGTEELEKVVDTIYSQTRFTMLVNWADALHYMPFLEEVKAILAKHFSADEYYVTGILPILVTTMSVLGPTMANSYTLALILIIPLIMVMVGSVKAGALAMIPNFMPILICLGLMPLLSISLDTFTLLVGGVAIGLVVDDTIHFLHHFQRYFEATNDVEESIRNTLSTTGRAMLFTTIALSLGFSVFTFSSMHNLTNFGLLTAMAIVLALIADILVMPALVKLTYKPRETNNAKELIQ